MKTGEDIAWLPEGTIVTCPHGNLAGEYTVLRQQNRGTSGLVYQVQSNRTGEIHALKEFYVKGAVRLQDLTLRIPETTEAGTLKELFMDEPVAFTQSEARTNDDHDGLAIPRSEVFVWQGNSYYLMDIYAMGAMIAYLCMLPYKHVIHERDEIHMRNFLHEMRYHPRPALGSSGSKISCSGRADDHCSLVPFGETSNRQQL